MTRIALFRVVESIRRFSGERRGAASAAGKAVSRTHRRRPDAHPAKLTMLRGLSGAAMRVENYFVADIAAGRVGAEQTPPKREFLPLPAYVLGLAGWPGKLRHFIARFCAHLSAIQCKSLILQTVVLVK